MRVRVEDLGLVYHGADGRGVTVLDHLDLDVADGSVHALVGPNGCGKTSLLRVIAGLEVPTSGRVEFIGEQRRPNRSALVFDTPRLLPWWTVERNIGTGLEFDPRRRSMYRKVTDFHTGALGLGALRRRLPGALSRGQQSRVGIGRGLAHDAEVMLLDEPFAHLDALLQRALREEFETFWQLEPRTTVLVTHDLEEAVVMADRVSVMRAAGPLVDTIEVDAERPRTALPLSHPGILSATRRVWDALQRSVG